MANGVFNIAKGMVNALHDNVAAGSPANSALIVVLLKTVEADATLKDYDTLGAILAGSNVECDFTNYARKTLVAADISASTVNDTSDTRDADIPDPVWTSAGGAANNTTAKLLICYDPDTTGGTDADIIPLTFHDFVATTSGTDLPAVLPAGGYFSAE